MLLRPQELSPAHIAPTARIAGISAVAGDQNSSSKIKDELRDRQRKWLEQIVNLTGNSPQKIGEIARVPATSLQRLLYNPDYLGTLSQISVDRIKAAFNVPGPDDGSGGKAMPLLGFSEAERFEAANEAAALSRVIEQLVAGRISAVAWRLKTDALEEAGYLSGDLVIVDNNVTPAPQDAVCAQVFDWKGGGAETVWRVFTPPFLIGAARDRTAYKPLMVDQDRVVIRGVIVESFRPHRLSALR